MTSVEFTLHNQNVSISVTAEPDNLGSYGLFRAFESFLHTVGYDTFVLQETEQGLLFEDTFFNELRASEPFNDNEPTYTLSPELLGSDYPGNPFKPGDKVVCVDNGCTGLNLGEVYEVKSLRDHDFVYMTNGCGYFTSRFILAPEKPIDPNYILHNERGSEITTQADVEAAEALTVGSVVKVVNPITHLGKGYGDDAVEGRVGTISEINLRRGHGNLVYLTFSEDETFRRTWWVNPRSLEVLYNPADASF